MTFYNPGQVIIKFNFNSLFVKAWIAAITPANLIAGFKSCGIYPLNRSAIVIPGKRSTTVKPSDPSPASTVEVEDSSSTEACFVPDGTAEDAVRHLDTAPLQFTVEQVALFERRFEEGWDVFIDKEYIRWLKWKHPEFHIKDTSAIETTNDHVTPDVIT